jgi:hypothetical protein
MGSLSGRPPMARRYSAVLGFLAFAVTCVRGIAVGGTCESTLGYAIACLAVFAVLGGIAGWLAEGIVAEAIRSRLAAEITNQPTASTRKAVTRR